MKTLIVIDMQPYFPSARDESTIQAVADEVRAAMKRDDFIFFVEYHGCGHTDARLTDLTKDYAKAVVVKKWGDNGSISIVKQIEALGVPKDSTFLVCGVNTHACVSETVNGMSKRLQDATISVVRKACNSDWGHIRSWVRFGNRNSRQKNVKIIAA